MRETADEGRGISGLELLETAAIDDAGDDFPWVNKLVEVDGGEAIEVVRVV